MVALFTTLLTIAVVGHNSPHETFGLKAKDDSSSL